MRVLALPVVAAALAAGCSSPQELTGAAAARSRGAVFGELPPAPPPPPAEDPLADYARVLARVNGKVITLRQIRHLLGPTYDLIRNQPELLNDLISRKTRDLVLKQLLLDEFEKLGLKARDEDMKRDYEEQEEDAIRKGSTIEQGLLDLGVTRREWDQQRKERMETMWAEQCFSGFFPERFYSEEGFRPSVDAYVGPGEVRRWAEDHREIVMYVPEQASIRILDLRKDSYGGPGAAEAEKWRLCGEAMDAAVARIAGGESFADVARALSEGPEAADGGLVTGVTRESALRSEYLEFTFGEATKPGQVSDRIRLPTGYVVVLLETRQDAHTLPIEVWGPRVRAELEGRRRELVRSEVLLRLLEEAAVFPREFRDSLHETLQERARQVRESLR